MKNKIFPKHDLCFIGRREASCVRHERESSGTRREPRGGRWLGRTCALVGPDDGSLDPLG
jgi:hypothetical protein